MFFGVLEIIFKFIYLELVVKCGGVFWIKSELILKKIPTTDPPEADRRALRARGNVRLMIYEWKRSIFNRKRAKACPERSQTDSFLQATLPFCPFASTLAERARQRGFLKFSILYFTNIAITKPLFCLVDHFWFWTMKKYC